MPTKDRRPAKTAATKSAPGVHDPSAAPRNGGDPAHAAVDSRRFEILALLGLFGLSWLVWAWIGTRHLVPNLYPDELIYGKVSQSFAASNGLSWRGQSFGIPPLWPLLISLGWHLGSLVDGWHAIKIAQTGLLSTVVFPAWLLARTVVGNRLALVAAGLAAAGTWMAVSAFMLSENLVYPVATASIAAMVVALQTSRARWIYAALALAALATAARTQMLALAVVFAVALVLDVARQEKGKRAERFDAWPPALWIALCAGVVGLLATFIVKPHLTNYAVGAHHVAIGKVFSTAAHHGGDVIVAAAFIPALAVVALMLDKSSWRDRLLGPVLVMTAAMLIVLLPLLGRFEGYATQGATVERYSMYVMPLLLTALVAAPGRLTRRNTAIAGTALLAALFVLPHTHNMIEQPALFGTQRRVAFMLGIFGGRLRPAVVLAVLPIMAIGVFALARRNRRSGLAIAVGVTALVMIVQSSGYQNRILQTEAVERATLAPSHFDWLDRAGGAPVDILAVGTRESMRHSLDVYTPLFNRSVRNAFITSPGGDSAPGCAVKVQPGGALAQKSGWCTPWRGRYLLVNSPIHATFVGERVVTATPDNGWIITLPKGPPRLFALVGAPCSITGCTGSLWIGFYLKASASVRAVFSGASVPHKIQVGNKLTPIPAGRDTAIDFALPKGNASVTLPVDWNDLTGPRLKSVVLNTAGRAHQIW